MKALSLSQPWASLMATGEKKVETRSWRTEFRGLVAIHASAKFSVPHRQLADTHVYFNTALRRHDHHRPRGEGLPRGRIVAVAELMGCFDAEGIEWDLSAQELAFGDYSVGRYAWMFENHVQLPEPVECKGMLGLWKVPVDIEEEIRHQLRTGGHEYELGL